MCALAQELGVGSLVGYDGDDGDVKGGERLQRADDHQGVEVED